MNNKLRVIYILIVLIALLILTIISILILNTSTKPKMIDLIGKDLEEVKKFVQKNDLELIIEEEYNDEIAKNKVITQSIAKNKIIKKNNKLKVTISLGKIGKEVYEKYSVNELGRVPIMMYHGIHNVKSSETGYTGGNIDKEGYQRTYEAFKQDLLFYYENGYRMIKLSDYINGVIDVELGKSPIILTFDDGLKNNINVTGIDQVGDLIIDPNCAVGILEDFKSKYPEFNVTATFFLNGGLFQQTKYNEKILKWLIDHGYEIGNHSYGHSNFAEIDSLESQMEIGKMYQKLENIIPEQYVKIVALPFGSPYKKEHPNFKYITEGVYDNFKYKTDAILRVGWESDLSPFSKNFDKYFLKRIRAYDNNGLDYDIEMNFDKLKENRYISDGNKNKVVISKEDVGYINNNIDLEIISY